jgi:putative ABC transport system ATP-binding protein
MAMSPLLRIEQLSKVYNRHRPDEMMALTDLSFQISSGDVVALTGPSGSGKTTMLSLLGCLSRPTTGSIHFKERNISRLPERFLAHIRRESFGFVFQQYNLLRDCSVLENVMLPLYPSDQPWREIKQAAVQLLERFDLAGMQRKKVKLLSGGEQQRVAIARALIADPDVVIADEPTAHLDRDLSEDLLDILAGLNDVGKTIIIATHDPLIYNAGLIKRRINLRHGQLDEESAP